LTLDVSAVFAAGSFVNNLRSGQGTLTLRNAGEKYVGSFSSDQIHGQGEYQYACGDIYAGNFDAWKRQGTGTHRYAITNGDKKGSKDQLHSKGSASSSRREEFQATYVGQWVRRLRGREQTHNVETTALV
jgi:hypothetical protein